MKTCSDCRKQFEEGDNKYATKCPACEKIFNDNCDRYRVMRKSIAGKSFEEQRDAINRFRCGL